MSGTEGARPGGAAPRAFGQGEAAVLAALHARAFAPEERWGEAAIRLMLGLEGSFGLLGGPAEAPLGFVLARAVAGEAEVLTLAVEPAVQGLSA